MNTLSIDIGNSSIKVDAWSDEGFIGRIFEGEPLAEDILNVSKKWKVEGIIVSSVRKDYRELIGKLRDKFTGLIIDFNEDEYRKFYDLSLYKGHLGADRVAAFLGAKKLLPNQAMLILDAGTAITLDIADEKGNFCGGNISLGLQSRKKALAESTSLLPYVKGCDLKEYFGKDTQSAIELGAQNGVVGEIKYSVELAKKEFDIHMLIATGGEADIVDSLVIDNIIIRKDKNLVGRGLDFHLRSKYLTVGCPLF